LITTDKIVRTIRNAAVILGSYNLGLPQTFRGADGRYAVDRMATFFMLSNGVGCNFLDDEHEQKTIAYYLEIYVSIDRRHELIAFALSPWGNVDWTSAA